MDGMKYDIYMDRECVALCDAINELPNTSTISSCCGHFERPYQIWLKTKNPYSVAVLARTVDNRYIGSVSMGWKLTVETCDAESDPQYCYRLHSEKPYADYGAMMTDINKIIENIEYWKSPSFYNYFKHNQEI